MAEMASRKFCTYLMCPLSRLSPSVRQAQPSGCYKCCPYRSSCRQPTVSLPIHPPRLISIGNAGGERGVYRS
ncbi:hypothetical protein PLICRDRAFT_502693 [Plicaturopsis crispa FD-325 SS-3]|nr:hypothetical protein PLICRDRAFT_502693 [Plicaturopsis crispa FD-325 SS-3]